MNRWLDPLLGVAFNRLGDVALASFTLVSAAVCAGHDRSRFAERIARQRAAAAFFNARRKVPAYAAFLRERGAFEPRRFEDIPPMDKATYVQRWPLEALCQGGKLPLRGAVIDESSGSSGQASNWIRGADERAATRRLIQYSARATFGAESFVLLNAFALGPWATGMNVSMSLVDRCVLKSIGPDAEQAVRDLRAPRPEVPLCRDRLPAFPEGSGGDRAPRLGAV